MFVISLYMYVLVWLEKNNFWLWKSRSNLFQKSTRTKQWEFFAQGKNVSLWWDWISQQTGSHLLQVKFATHCATPYLVFKTKQSYTIQYCSQSFHVCALHRFWQIVHGYIWKSVVVIHLKATKPCPTNTLLSRMEWNKSQ